MTRFREEDAVISLQELDQENNDDTFRFGTFRISSSQIFYRSPSTLTVGIVNLRPIVPGHVLVVPSRVVPKLADLKDEEYDDLWRSVKMVQHVLQQCYHTIAADNHVNGAVRTDSFGFNVAVQDGPAAGQSVPHVHVHILPRNGGDFQRNDDIYDALQDWAPTNALAEDKIENGRGRGSLLVPSDENRRDRTMQEMEDEASRYRSMFMMLG